MSEAYSCAACGAETENEPQALCDACDQDDRDAISERMNRYREALKPWGSGGIITGTVLAWIAAKDPAIAKAIVNGKAAVDRALN